MYFPLPVVLNKSRHPHLAEARVKVKPKTNQAVILQTFFLTPGTHLEVSRGKGAGATSNDLYESEQNRS